MLGVFSDTTDRIGNGKTAVSMVSSVSAKRDVSTTIKGVMYLCLSLKTSTAAGSRETGLGRQEWATQKGEWMVTRKMARAISLMRNENYP